MSNKTYVLFGGLIWIASVTLVVMVVLMVMVGPDPVLIAVVVLSFLVIMFSRLIRALFGPPEEHPIAKARRESRSFIYIGPENDP